MSKYSPVGIGTLATVYRISERHVRNLIKAGVLPGPSEMKGRRPLYDFWPHLYVFIGYLTQRRGPESIEEKKAANLEKRNQKLDLDIKEREGELVNVKEYNRIHADHVSDAKKRLRALPSKCTQEVLHLKLSKKSERAKMAAIQDVLMKQCNEVAEDLKNWKPQRRMKK